MNLAKPFFLVLLTGLMAACVTINVYFPAADAEKAADLIIDQVYQGKGGEESAPSPSSEEPPADQQSRWQSPARLAAMGFSALFPAAHAQADFNISSPRIQALQNRMANRHTRLAGFYQSGALGIQSDGMLTLRNLNAVPLPSRNQAKTLVAEDNADRAALYREIAQANGHPEWEGQIREVFAQRWRDKALSGWWIQQANGQWARKP